MAKIKFIIILLSFSILNILVGSCQSPEVHYATGASCSPDYPILLHAGTFRTPDNDYVVILERNLNGPWGSPGVAYIVGNGFNKLPNKLKVAYFSGVENKFYEGTFDLPYEQIKSMFNEPSDNPFYKGKTFRDEQSGRTLKRMKYTSLNVAFALDGLVTAWICGWQAQKLLGLYRAKEVDQKWNDIFEYGTREESWEDMMKNVFTDKVKKEILTNTLPFDLWPTYLKKYKWKYTVDFGSKGNKLEELYFKMLNQEVESYYYDSPRMNNDSLTARALPYYFDLKWTDRSGKKMGARVVFNAEDMYHQNIYNSGGVKIIPDELEEIESYKIVHQLNPAELIEIILKIDSENAALKVFFKQGSQEILARNMNIKVFERN